MSTENLQNNLKFFLTEKTEKKEDGIYRIYRIVDGTAKINEAHVFFEGTVKEASVEQMYKEMQSYYCDWYADNRAEIRKYYARISNTIDDEFMNKMNNL
ncbi:hypothetical protein LNJ40_09735 [Tenacibaculum dicentrarchi]|nr:hypothetical protein [Tenacibaculum dicentrarchi]